MGGREGKKLSKYHDKLVTSEFHAAQRRNKAWLEIRGKIFNKERINHEIYRIKEKGIPTRIQLLDQECACSVMQHIYTK